MLYEFAPGGGQTQQAYIHGVGATRAISKAEQKALGQYMTPPAIAQFMARRAVQGLSGHTLRILEPAAGSGVLAAAAIEAVLDLAEVPERIELLLFEIDCRFLPALQHMCQQLQRRCMNRMVDLDYRILPEDFLLSQIARSKSLSWTW